MNANHVIQTRPGEWLATYSPVGNVCHFTTDRLEATRVCMEYEPSARWAREAADVARRVYRRAEARIVMG